jgi:diketogulonate reductase-like aldo/keto reductase
MEYVQLHGDNVPALGFGTWLLRDEACYEGLKHALELGYRHIDTAQGYDNEQVVGQALVDSGIARGDIFLTTKVKPDNFSPTDLLDSSRESLRKLQTDHVDLLLLHWPNPNIPLEDTLAALQQLQDEGATRHIGISNFPPLQAAQAAAQVKIFCNQVEYHPFLAQSKLLAQAAELDYMLTAYSPIARGKVIGDDVLEQIAHTHHKTSVQVTLRWQVQQARVSTIPKAASAAHRESNFDIFDFELSEDEMNAIFALNREERLVDPEGLAPAWER